MKLRRTVALMIAFAALVSGTASLASNQDPKAKPKTDDKKKVDDKKDDKKPQGKIEIYEAKKGWRYRILNNDDKTVAMPAKSYEKKEDVLKELELIKSILNSEKPKEVKE